MINNFLVSLTTQFVVLIPCLQKYFLQQEGLIETCLMSRAGGWFCCVSTESQCHLYTLHFTPLVKESPLPLPQSLPPFSPFSPVFSAFFLLLYLLLFILKYDFTLRPFKVLKRSKFNFALFIILSTAHHWSIEIFLKSHICVYFKN